MKILFPQSMSLLIGICLASHLVCAQEVLPFGYDAFLDPYRAVDVAASESGRVVKVQVQRGSRVKAGDILLELDSSVLEASHKVALIRANSSARVDALNVELAQKQKRLEALYALSRDGAVTQDEIIKADGEVRISTLQVAAAMEEQEQAQLEAAEILAQIRQRRVTVSFDGIVTDVLRNVDEFVSSVDPVVAKVIDLSRLRATFFIKTSDVVALKAGTVMSMTNLDTGALLHGTIEFIGPVTQSDSGRVRLDVVVENPDESIRAGLRCRLELGERKSVVEREAAAPGRLK